MAWSPAAADMRAWTSFDAKSQATLRAGGTVTGGDGRKFVLIDGHAVVVGSGSYTQGMALRNGTTTAAVPAAVPVVAPTAPAVGPGRPHPFSSNDGGMDTPAAPTGPVATDASVDTPVGVISHPVTSAYTPPTPQPDPAISPTAVDPTTALLTQQAANSAAAAAAVKAASNRDALAILKSTFATYGLPDSLTDWAWQEIVGGKSQNEVLLDLYQRPEFKNEYPEIDARQKAGLAPLSPGEIITYRQNAQQMMRAAGLPTGFYDSKDDFTNLLTKDVSLSELSSRVSHAAQLAYNTPAEDKQAFYDMGFGHGDLTAMFLNPDVAEPLLNKQFAAAQLSGTGVRSGFGSLTANEGLGLAEQGVTQGQAQQGFGNLVHQQELFNPLNQGENSIGRDEQLGAALGGNAQAQERIQNRARSRVAEFQGGGSFASGQSGISGLGAAR